MTRFDLVDQLASKVTEKETEAQKTKSILTEAQLKLGEAEALIDHVATVKYNEMQSNNPKEKANHTMMK